MCSLLLYFHFFFINFFFFRHLNNYLTKKYSYIHVVDRLYIIIICLRSMCSRHYLKHLKHLAPLPFQVITRAESRQLRLYKFGDASTLIKMHISARWRILIIKKAWIYERLLTTYLHTKFPLNIKKVWSVFNFFAFD